MRRQLGWLCLLPALASLTTTHAFAAVAPSAPASNSAAAPAALPAVPDYGPATWVPADPANYTVANRGHDYPVQMIIIHDTEGSYASAIQEFQDPTRAGSAHYVVSDQGDITQMVAEKDVAWHAGNWDYNTRAIGIEHEGYAWSCCYYTDAMYDASARLAASICSRWGVPMNRQNVIGHDEVPDPDNPGLFGGTDHHTDPGPYWDWTDYINRAAYYASLLPSPPHLMPDPTAVLNSATSATVNWQKAGTCHSPITGYTVTGQPDSLVMNLPASATSATFTGLRAGVTYTFTVTATNADGQDSGTAQWRCLLAQVGAAPGSPQLSGTTVQLSGTSTGCPNPRYQFWIHAPASSTWTIAQAYSSAATFSWNTNGAATGTYNIGVWARDASSAGATASSLGTFDSFAGSTYTLTSQPCASAAAAAAPPSASTPGTPVTFTGSATGCPKPLYQFWMLAPGSSTWQIAQAYSTSATFNWSTAGLTGGTYHISIWVRDTSSVGTSCTSLGCNDAFAAIDYTLTSTACVSVTASAAPPSPSASGSAVTFTGRGSGCPNPLYEFCECDLQLEHRGTVARRHLWLLGLGARLQQRGHVLQQPRLRRRIRRHQLHPELHGMHVGDSLRRAALSVGAWHRGHNHRRRFGLLKPPVPVLDPGSRVEHMDGGAGIFDQRHLELEHDRIAAGHLPLLGLGPRRQQRRRRQHQPGRLRRLRRHLVHTDLDGFSYPVPTSPQMGRRAPCLNSAS